ncbi:MAG: class I SAM-dependent methyltransferase [Inquilinus sp.]|uniref:class I SAM-dependent methyltransferase n=1 Tax=Inquilinus sp. TaxID=1932117 RepID=UPI003F3F3019
MTKSSEFEALKARLKAMWMAGDVEEIAKHSEVAAQEFVGRRGIKPGVQVLDVACGSGNLAIPAAKAGAIVTGIDISSNFLAEARERAAGEALSIAFHAGGAEELPYQKGSFDLVVSMFGAMFAPRPDRVADELLRVCRPGGQIAMANWTPTGFIGQVFKVTGHHVSPPAEKPSPLSWGDPVIVRQRFGERVSELQMTPVTARLHYPFPVPETVEFFRTYYGPTQRAFAALPEVKQPPLRRDLELLWSRHNRASDGTTLVEAEYLEVVATRS